jgi:hypothetical protein
MRTYSKENSSRTYSHDKPSLQQGPVFHDPFTVAHPGMETGISEASKRVPIFSLATQGGKQVSFYFGQELRQVGFNRLSDTQIRLPAA